jgi:outer membrane beta-barrel protein
MRALMNLALLAACAALPLVTALAPSRADAQPTTAAPAGPADASSPSDAERPAPATTAGAASHATQAAPTSAGQSTELRTTELCIDQAIADRLALKRKRRGAVDRLFVKQARHEVTLSGGFYSSDLFSSTYIAGAAYSFHMTEETSVELATAYARANADVIRALEDKRGQAIGDTSDRVVFFESLLMWSPIYGKLRFGGSILHFDLNAGLGVGVVDAETSRGAAGALGFGMKLFLGQAVAVRIDARNRTFYQELLDKRFLVNDSAITLGVSLFLPTRN